MKHNAICALTLLITFTEALFTMSPSIPIIGWIYKNTPPLHESACARSCAERRRELESDSLLESQIKRLIKRRARRNHRHPKHVYQYLAGTTGGCINLAAYDIHTQASPELNDNRSDTTELAVISKAPKPSPAKYDLEEMD